MASEMISPITVSVVVPVYAGEAYLPRLIDELESVRRRWEIAAAPMRLLEVFLVDDNARDNSAAVIDRIAAEKDWVTALHLSRNFGQHAATIAGILRTRGDWIATMDEDLQHPPSRLDDLLRAAAAHGHDIVYANAEDAVHETLIRDFSSRFFKKAIEVITINPSARYFNSFRLVRGGLARAASETCRHDSYLDVTLSWFTKRIGTVRMRLKDDRVIGGGGSGYRLKSLLSHARRMLMASHIKYLRLAGLFGFFVVILSALASVLLLIQKLFLADSVPVTGWTSLSLITIFFGGITAFLVGIALEYISFLVLNSRGMPLFFIVDRKSDEIIRDYFSGRPGEKESDDGKV